MASRSVKTVLFCNDLSEMYLCSICRKVLMNPIQTDCGHRYCMKCFHRNVGGKCQGIRCNGILRSEKIYKDRAIQHDIHCLKVTCMNGTCNWTGLYKDYNEEHVLICPCGSVTNTLAGCKTRVNRINLAVVWDHDCCRRLTSRPNSQLKEMNRYRDFATKECPYCHKVIESEQMGDHLNPESQRCIEVMIPCSDTEDKS
ncbi:TNF receptor-associated factor 2-like [Glandiceps talaboti]